jgi:flagellar protein FliT
MTSSEVLSMYENIAGMTNHMAAAARMGDWDGLSKLENRAPPKAAPSAPAFLP